MYVLAVNHDVEDYDRFKAVFDSYPPTQNGAVFHRVNRGVPNENNITVVCGFTSVEAANDFQNDPVLKEKMGAAGVSSPPRFELFTEVESVAV